MSGKPGRRALDRPSVRSSFLVLAGFTAVLCWWVAVVGFINTGAGTVFLVLPVIPTVLTLVLARRGSGRKAKHVGPPHGQAVASVISPYRSSMFVLAAFATALFWWIGIVGVVSSGGGAQVFLAVPTVATVGMVLAFLVGRKRRDSLVVRMHPRGHGAGG
jgi:uncharacterized membrane protein